MTIIYDVYVSPIPRCAGKYVVQFRGLETRTYTASTEVHGNGIYVYRATSCNGAGNFRSFNRDRHDKLLSKLQHEIEQHLGK